MSINIVENPRVQLGRIGDPARPAGISAFLRVKNGAASVIGGSKNRAKSARQMAAYLQTGRLTGH